MDLSFETIELLGAWEWKGFQFTAGPSYILHTDSDLKRYSVQAGIDYQSREAGLQTDDAPVRRRPVPCLGANRLEHGICKQIS